MLKLKQALKLKEQNDPYLIFLVAMLKVTPCVLLRSIRLGSGSKGIPMPISEQKQIAYAIKWTLKLLKEKQGSLKVSSLAELLVASSLFAFPRLVDGLCLSTTCC